MGLPLQVAPQDPEQTLPPKELPIQAKPGRILLIIDGKRHGLVTILFSRPSPKPGAGDMAVMVPVRTIMEAAGWKVDYFTATTVNSWGGTWKGSGAVLDIIAPFSVEHAVEDLDPVMRGVKSHPHGFLFVGMAESELYSPQLKAGEGWYPRPMPVLYKGQTYAPLDSLMTAIGFLNLGNVNAGAESVSMSFLKEKAELRIIRTRSQARTTREK